MLWKSGRSEAYVIIGVVSLALTPWEDWQYPIISAIKPYKNIEKGEKYKEQVRSINCMKAIDTTPSDS